jgi:hypothetical protein
LRQRKDSRDRPDAVPWRGKELREYVDGPTGQVFISWDDGYGRPSGKNFFYWDGTKPVGQRYRSFMPLQQRAFIFAALYAYMVQGKPYDEIVQQALQHQIRVPGEYPLTRHCLKMWEATRRRQSTRGQLWPFRNVEEFDQTGLPRVLWEKYLQIDEIHQFRPALGVNHGKEWEQNRMGEYKHHSGLRLYQRERALFDPPRRGKGTIRQRVWYEVIRAASGYEKQRTDEAKARFIGSAIAYATFVDPYSMADEHRTACIKTVMREALKYAKDE